MAKLLKLVLLLAASCMVECNSDDDHSQPQLENSIVGAWELKSLDKGWGQVTSFKAGDVIYTFSEDQLLVITNNTSISLSPLPDTGTYQCVVNTDHQITINGIVFDYYVDMTNLRLSKDVEADGVCYQFSKIRPTN